MYKVIYLASPKNRFYSGTKWETKLSFLSRLGGEQAAELAYHITNAPEECLTRAQQRWQRRLFNRCGFTGPSLSVGDVVRVVDTINPRYTNNYICQSSGWAKITFQEVIDSEITSSSF